MQFGYHYNLDGTCMQIMTAFTGFDENRTLPICCPLLGYNQSITSLVSQVSYHLVMQSIDQNIDYSSTQRGCPEQQPKQ